MRSQYLAIAKQHQLRGNAWRSCCVPLLLKPQTLSLVDKKFDHHATHTRQQKQERSTGDQQWNKWGVAALVAAGFGGVWAYRKGYLTSEKKHGEGKAHAEAAVAMKQDASNMGVQMEAYDEGDPLPNLPSYTMEDIAKHDSIEKRIWATFRQGVYDITDYVSKHPGGENILMAAGGATDPFWNVYAIHKEPHVMKVLARFRIGNISAEEYASIIRELDNPFVNEPRRHPALKTASKFPFNAEAPLELLGDSFLTPPELHYVRNHFAVPKIDEKDYVLELEGLGFDESLTFSLADLKTLPKHSLAVTLQCAGNRRAELMDHKPIDGIRWDGGMISNAVWTGVRLHDFLKAANVDFDKYKDKHIQFEGTDVDPIGRPFGSSVPATRVFTPDSDILIAYEMNGKPLPPDHGYPVRILVPGVAGVRSCKWVRRIIIADEESESLWQRSHYKGFTPSETPETADMNSAPSTMEMPVNSAFTCPREGDKVKVQDGKIKVKGYAWSGGGKPIFRVDVSADGGENWHRASLDYRDESRCINTYNGCYAWTLWSASIPVPPGTKEANLVVKAVDAAYNTQPANVKDIWNFCGVLSNAYHKVKVALGE